MSIHKYSAECILYLFLQFSIPFMSQFLRLDGITYSVRRKTCCHTKLHLRKGQSRKSCELIWSNRLHWHIWEDRIDRRHMIEIPSVLKISLIEERLLDRKNYCVMVWKWLEWGAVFRRNWLHSTWTISVNQVFVFRRQFDLMLAN